MSIKFLVLSLGLIYLWNYFFVLRFVVSQSLLSVAHRYVNTLHHWICLMTLPFFEYGLVYDQFFGGDIRVKKKQQQKQRFVEQPIRHKLSRLPIAAGRTKLSCLFNMGREKGTKTWKSLDTSILDMKTVS